MPANRGSLLAFIPGLMTAVQYGWLWYGELLGNGAWFLSHPAIQTATLLLENPDHPGAGFTEAATRTSGTTSRPIRGPRSTSS